MAPADPTLTSEMHGRPTSLEAGVPPTARQPFLDPAAGWPGAWVGARGRGAGRGAGF